MKPTKHIIKSGEEIVVRLATMEDASPLLKLKLDYIENSTTIPLSKNEYSDDIELENLRLTKFITEKNSALFVAEYNGKLIGNIDLKGNQRIKLFHTGVIGMGIQEGWRGLGVGKALLSSILDWTSTNTYITLLWLEVYDSNLAGKALYQKMGFQESGRIKDFFCENDAFIDKITMVRHL